MLAEAPLRSVRDRILALRSLPNFAGLDEEGMVWLAEAGQAVHLEPGDVLSEEGDPVTSVHIVTAGCIRVTRGPRVVDVTRGFGAGFLSVLGRDERGIRAEATEPTSALAIPVTAILEAYEEQPSFIRNALRNLAGNLMSSRGDLPARPDRLAEPALGARWAHRPTLVERILVMRQEGLFAEVNLDAVVDVARGLREVDVPAGHVLWRVGDPPAFSLRIGSGHVRCRAPSGAEVTVGAGYVLGAMDPLSDLPRRYAAEAITPVQGFRLEQDPFLSVIESHPKVGLELAAILARALLEQQ